MPSRAKADRKRELETAYHRFMKAQDPSRKEEAGKDLVRAIFGKDAIAEDTLL